MQVTPSGQPANEVSKPLADMLADALEGNLGPAKLSNQAHFDVGKPRR
jgi:hypothetical protein